MCSVEQPKEGSMWYSDTDTMLADAMIAFGVGVFIYSILSWLGPL